MSSSPGEVSESTQRWWRSSQFKELLYRHWEEETFVFNPATGHTHILNDVSWQLLLACAESARSNQQLFELMRPDDFSEISEQEVATTLIAHLDQLEQLNLIQSMSSHAIH